MHIIQRFYNDTFCFLDFICIVTELGFTSLRQWLAQRNEIQEMAIDRNIMYEWFRDICQGVNYLHNCKGIHGNLKPENILLTKENMIKICDIECCSDRTHQFQMNTMVRCLYKRNETPEGYFPMSVDIYPLGEFQTNYVSKREYLNSIIPR